MEFLYVFMDIKIEKIVSSHFRVILETFDNKDN